MSGSAGGGGGYGVGFFFTCVIAVGVIIAIALFGFNIYFHLKLGSLNQYKSALFWVAFSFSTLSLLSLKWLGFNLIPLLIPFIHIALLAYQIILFRKNFGSS